MNQIKMSRKEAEKARHETILKVSMAEFSKRGFHGADVEDIARKANVGKGTVYRHFESKRQLFLSVIEWGIDKLIGKINTATDGINELREGIHVGLFVFFRFFEEHKDFYRVLFVERSNFMEFAGKKHAEKFSRYIHLFEKSIQEGIEAGMFLKVDSHQCALLLIGMVHALIFEWLKSPADERLTEKVAIVEEIFFNGLLQR